VHRIQDFEQVKLQKKLTGPNCERCQRYFAS
jgi:hypothetical protein